MSGRLDEDSINENFIPTLEYGESELSPDDAIALYPALRLLGDDWTAEEFALQVFYDGIRAFKKHDCQTALKTFQ